MFKIKKIKVLPIFLLAVLLLGTTAFANVDLGFTQDLVGGTNLRMDVSHFAFELPTGSNIREFSLGAKAPAMFYDAYLIGFADFKKVCTKVRFDKLKVGVGYPIKFGDFVIRSEFRVATPEWANFSTWQYETMIGIQLRFGALTEDKGV